MNITIIEKIEKETSKGPLQIAKLKIVENNNKIELGVSKYADESHWLWDYQFSNGRPIFCHGEGSRCCIKQYSEEIDKVLK